MKMKLFLCVIAASLCATSTHAAVYVKFQSGNGRDLNKDNVADPYQPDELVRFVPYNNQPVPEAPLEADFEAIRNFKHYQPRSVAATILPQTTNGWLTGGSPTTETAAPVFNLVSSNIYGATNSSSLFGIPFSIGEIISGEHYLNFNFKVDNYLGFNASLDFEDDYTESVSGLYLNGIPLGGGSIAYDPDIRFAEDTWSFNIDESSLISNDVNYLYMLVTDRAPSSGIVFSGEIGRIVPNPEPATLVIWAALGIIGLTIGIRRRRR